MSAVKLPPLPEALRYSAERWPDHGEAIAEYARQAVLAERERCARICDELPSRPEYEDNHDVSDGAEACAAAIRGMG